MWEARADYMSEDSIETIERYFEASATLPEEEDRYNIERWLIERRPGCVWYSVNWIDE